MPPDCSTRCGTSHAPRGAPTGFATASNPRTSNQGCAQAAAGARRTDPNTSAAPAAGSWSPGSGRARRLATTAPIGGRGSSRCSATLTSGPTRPGTPGNRSRPATRISGRSRADYCSRSPNAPAGAPRWTRPNDAPGSTRPTARQPPLRPESREEDRSHGQAATTPRGSRALARHQPEQGVWADPRRPAPCGQARRLPPYPERGGRGADRHADQGGGSVSASRRRGHGEGAVYQRKEDGIWVGALDLGWVEGKRRRKIVYGKTRREVLSKLDEVRRGAERGQNLAARTRALAEWLDEWLTEIKSHDGTRPTTLRRYRE